MHDAELFTKLNRSCSSAAKLKYSPSAMNLRTSRTLSSYHKECFDAGHVLATLPRFLPLFPPALRQRHFKIHHRLWYLFSFVSTLLPIPDRTQVKIIFWPHNAIMSILNWYSCQTNRYIFWINRMILWEIQQKTPSVSIVMTCGFAGVRKAEETLHYHPQR